jgi:hypothetical protein
MEKHVSEISIPTPPEPPGGKYSIDNRLGDITTPDVRKILESLIADLPSWKKDKILIEPDKYSISVKAERKVFMYLSPRRDKFLVETNNPEGKWVAYSVNSNEDLNRLMVLMKGNMEKKLR